MSNETRWRVICDNRTSSDDLEFTSTREVAEAIAENQLAMHAEQGWTENVKVIRADMAEGRRADLIGNVRVAIGELSDAEAILNQAIGKVSNIDAAAQTVHSLASVLADAALALHEHEELLEPRDRGY